MLGRKDVESREQLGMGHPAPCDQKLEKSPDRFIEDLRLPGPVRHDQNWSFGRLPEQDRI